MNPDAVARCQAVSRKTFIVAAEAMFAQLRLVHAAFRKDSESGPTGLSGEGLRHAQVAHAQQHVELVEALLNLVSILEADPGRSVGTVEKFRTTIDAANAQAQRLGFGELLR